MKKYILIALLSVSVPVLSDQTADLQNAIDQNTTDATSIAAQDAKVKTDAVEQALKFKMTNAPNCALLVLGTTATGSVPVYFVPGPMPVSGLQADVMDANGITVTGVVSGADTDSMGKQISSNNIGGGFRFILIGFNQTPLKAGEVATVNIDASQASPGAHILTMTNFISTSPDGVGVPLCATTGVINK